MSHREQVLWALRNVIDQLENVQVFRNAVIPQRIPAGGLVIIRDGEPGEPEVTLSPTVYSYSHRIPVELYVAQDDVDKRDKQVDQILESMGDILNNNRSLNGLIEHMEWDAPVMDEELVEGAGDIKRSLVTVICHYTISNPLQ